MLARLTCMLAAGMGFVGGYLLAVAVAQDRAHNPLGLLSPVVPRPLRPAARGPKRPSGSRSGSTNGQRSSSKPARRKSKSSRARKNP